MPLESVLKLHRKIKVYNKNNGDEAAKHRTETPSSSLVQYVPVITPDLHLKTPQIYTSKDPKFTPHNTPKLHLKPPDLHLITPVIYIL